ncbi:MAG: dihydrolipoyl dehydrogenase [Flavobacteriaceae bacterium]|nr:dihydrolipoyl dehydrogenase [Flavobacteriaceae bacterium]MCY4253402.1 dihydrolipoyl dehydrogenase [Flavobacteriaceae bacterium]
MTDYDLIVLGSGPGGYVTAIRASQLGLKTAVVEKEDLGGVCLNWGCIPTKALLKSAQVFEYLKQADDYGFQIQEYNPDFNAIIHRSRRVAGTMSKGVNFLMKKNKITVINGYGKILPNKKVEIIQNNKSQTVSASNIIIATGAHSREIPQLKQDGEKIIGYRHAMSLKQQPKSMIVVGSGAIGVEFAFFYSSLGTKVSLIEYLDRIVPVEDVDVSKQLAKSFSKKGMEIFTKSEVFDVKTTTHGVTAKVKTPKGEKEIKADVLLSAVGIKSNIENIGLEDVGIVVDNDKILVDDFYKTNIPGYYAIGDITKGPALAHVASAEGILCVEKIAGHHPEPLDYGNVPGCTYCLPEVASVGLTEQQAREKGFDLKIGKFPFSASGKAQSAGKSEGFVKVIFDAKYGEFLGCHMIGEGVTDLIAEAVIARKLETTGHEMLKAIHPHPTLSEAVMEAVADAYGEVIHL